MTNQKNMSQSSSFFLQKIRRITQLVLFGVLGQWAYYGIFRCPFLVPFVNCENCPVITCWGRITAYFWGVWTLIPVSAILVGRAFCGWICPVGFVNQMIGKLSLYKLRVRNQFTKFSPIGMAVALLAVLFICVGLGNPRTLPPIRVGEVWGSVYLTFKNASAPWLIRTFIVLGIMAGGLLISNLWCRFVCPMGGLFELVKRVSVFRVFKTRACDDCNACLRNCEMGTRPNETNCNNCGACLKICHNDAIQFGRKKKQDD